MLVEGSGFLLRFWAALARIERGFFLVLLFSFHQLGMRYGENRSYASVKALERFRAFVHFRVRLHVFIMARKTLFDDTSNCQFTHKVPAIANNPDTLSIVVRPPCMHDVVPPSIFEVMGCDRGF